MLIMQKKDVHRLFTRTSVRAGNGTRTRDILLGKQTLYQLSYTRRVCLSIENTLSAVKLFIGRDGVALFMSRDLQ